MFRFERRLAGAILRLLASDGGAPAPRRPAARTASGGGFGRGAEPPSERASMAAVRADEIPVPRGRPRLTGRVRGWLDPESILRPVVVTPALLLRLLLV